MRLALPAPPPPFTFFMKPKTLLVEEEISKSSPSSLLPNRDSLGLQALGLLLISTCIHSSEFVAGHLYSRQ